MVFSIRIFFLSSLFLLISGNLYPQNKAVKPAGKKTAVTGKNKSHSNTLSFTDSLCMLKAVLVVGPTEETTENNIAEFKETAGFLKRLGVQVYEFYHPNALWDSIEKAANGAHFFLYSGHGTHEGENGSPGGLVITSPNFITSNAIYNRLKLHKNALILFRSVCMAAGSSADDKYNIGIKTATDRVSSYAKPFIKAGAGCYFAINTTGSSIPFLRMFFDKKPIENIYDDINAFFYKPEYNKPYRYDPLYQIGIASNTPSKDCYFTSISYHNGKRSEEKKKCFKTYPKAYVCKPGFSVNHLLQSINMPSKQQKE